MNNERMKANWAIAHAMVAVRPRLNKALRQAYTDTGDANGEALTVACKEAIALLACLREGLRYLDLPAPTVPESLDDK